VSLNLNFWPCLNLDSEYLNLASVLRLDWQVFGWIVDLREILDCNLMNNINNVDFSLSTFITHNRNAVNAFMLINVVS